MPVVERGSQSHCSHVLTTCQSEQSADGARLGLLDGEISPAKKCLLRVIQVHLMTFCANERRVHDGALRLITLAHEFCGHSLKNGDGLARERDVLDRDDVIAPLSWLLSMSISVSVAAPFLLP